MNYKLIFILLSDLEFCFEHVKMVACSFIQLAQTAMNSAFLYMSKTNSDCFALCASQSTYLCKIVYIDIIISIEIVYGQRMTIDTF